MKKITIMSSVCMIVATICLVLFSSMFFSSGIVYAIDQSLPFEDHSDDVKGFGRLFAGNYRFHLQFSETSNGKYKSWGHDYYIVYQGTDIDFYSYALRYHSSEDIVGIGIIAFSESYFDFQYVKYNQLQDTFAIETQVSAKSLVVGEKTIYYYDFSHTLNIPFDCYPSCYNGFPNMHEYKMQQGDTNQTVREAILDNIAKEFVTNGGLQWEDGSSIGASYDESLPIINNLNYKLLYGKDCHDDTFKAGCFNLSWNKPDGVIKDDMLEIRVVANYNYATYTGTKRYYDSGFFNYSDLYGLIPVTNFSNDFCVMTFISNLNIKNLTSIQLLPQKIYIRIVRNVSGNRSYGDWVVYDVNRNILNTPSIGKGEVIPGDSEFDDFGNYFEDSKGTIDPPSDNNSSFSFDFTDISSVLKTFKNVIEDLISALGTFPSMFSSVFSFLPAPFLNAIYLVLIVAIIIGILKIFT